MITAKTLLNGGVAYIHYGSDGVGGTKSFKEGDEFSGKILINFRIDPVILGLSLADIIRMKNQIKSANNKLTAEEKNSHGNRFDTTLTCQYLISRQLSVTPLAGLTIVGDNGYGKSGAFVWNVGGSVQFAPNRDSSVSLNVKYLKGNMESGDVDVSGFEVGSVILVKF